MMEREVFGSSVEGMLRALGPAPCPQVKAQLRAIGVDPDHLLPSYAVPTYLLLLDFIGARRFPELNHQERDRALGREFIRGFGQTFVGRTTFSMGRLIGPLRSTLRLSRTMRMVNNYSMAQATALTERSVEVWCHPVLRPWYYVGVFEQAGQELHDISYTVELQKFDDERADFLISW